MCKDDYPYIAAELKKEDYIDLLDCGCGTGPMISLLYEEDPGRHYTGIDLTPRMIEVARAKNLKGVDWVTGRLILQDYTAPKPVLWLMNHTEMPLANLIGHGDVAAYSLKEIQAFCDKAGLKVEKLEAAKKFRLHLAARKRA